MTPRRAQVQALLHTIAILEDTNLAHRGGWQVCATRNARRAIFASGRRQPPRRSRRPRAPLHRAFVARNSRPAEPRICLQRVLVAALCER